MMKEEVSALVHQGFKHRARRAEMGKGCDDRIHPPPPSASCRRQRVRGDGGEVGEGGGAVPIHQRFRAGSELEQPLPPDLTTEKEQLLPTELAVVGLVEGQGEKTGSERQPRVIDCGGVEWQ